MWVYCGDQGLCGEHHKECWLKHLAHPYGTAPAKEGPDVGWTTGIMVPRAETKPTVGAGPGGVLGPRWLLGDPHRLVSIEGSRGARLR